MGKGGVRYLSRNEWIHRGVDAGREGGREEGLVGLAGLCSVGGIEFFFFFSFFFFCIYLETWRFSGSVFNYFYFCLYIILRRYITIF